MEETEKLCAFLDTIDENNIQTIELLTHLSLDLNRHQEISEPLAIYGSKFAHSLFDIKEIIREVPFPSPTSHSFTFIDLFAGIGGFRLGLQANGGKCLFSSEWDIHAKKTYFSNYGEVPFGDITKKEVKQMIPKSFDLLAAGFPCQPFSISGKMKGFEDTRGTLIYEVFEILSKHKPSVVLLENVKHLVHHDKGRTLRIILKNLSELGYQTSWAILNASNFGVPQNRERIIIVGSIKGKSFDFSKIVKNSNRPILKDFLEKDANFQFLDEPYTLIDSPVVQKSGLIFSGFRNKKIRTTGVRLGTENLSRVHKQPNRIYSSDGVHPALPAQETSGRFWILHEGKVRKLTISECYRIMGFPEKFRQIGPLTEQYRQIGNSVCVPMVKAIAQQIINQKLL